MQDIAFRGETDESSNFYQVVQLVSRHCSLLKYWLNEKRMHPYHVTYMSRCSQNEFIKLIGDAVRDRVVKKLEEAPAFSVMADTTPDVSNKDQMSIVVRYVADNTPVERLLSLTVLEDKSGDGHATEILRCLNEHGINVEKLYFQSYDFTACMSGEYNGCHKKLNDKIQKDFPEKEIPYIPCQAHRLNTFVERSCKASTIVSSMFTVLQLLYSFFSSSTKRSEALAKAQEIIEGALKLRNLSQTRWIARSESIDSVWISFECVVSLLQKIVNKELKSDTNTQDQAKALLKKMKKYDFIFSLGIMKFIMRHCKLLAVQLQEGLNLLDAISLVSTTTKSLEGIRNETDVNNQVKAAVEMARQVGCDPEQEFSKNHRKRMPPLRLDDRRENEAEVGFASFYRKEMFSVLDQLIADCRENWNRVFANIKPFSVLLPPWEEVNETSADSLCMLLGGSITSGNLLGELSILR
ncbi:zinc finger MYM-type 1-like [Paramuricea clavata]|uniref:Zinc finger MYM-type 1-like n=1 Tax=Paramuricea clavata TaxID=317549 RepID=A0A6S7GEW0_PARCT|nr:zinc finger MYM-type 1-like [Paramuricea clavata]